MIGLFTTALCPLMVSNAENDKQVATGGVVANIGANTVNHGHRETMTSCLMKGESMCNDRNVAENGQETPARRSLPEDSYD